VTGNQCDEIASFLDVELIYFVGEDYFCFMDLINKRFLEVFYFYGVAGVQFVDVAEHISCDSAVGGYY